MCFALMAGAVLFASACGDGGTGTDIPPGDFTPLTSTFDSDFEGWGTNADAYPPSWQATNGNPEGYVSAIDRVNDDIWYWVAPTKFLNDVSGAYGRLLTFDLVQTYIPDETTPVSGDDVILSNGDITLVHRFSNGAPRLDDWTPYSVRLREDSWTNRETGQSATGAEMQAVLQNLQQLLIRGEYRKNHDEGGLDNVMLGASN